MKNKIFSLASSIACFVFLIAITAAGTASIFTMHQPEEPDSLNSFI